MRTRDIVERCQEYRERCIVAGRLVSIDDDQPQGASVPSTEKQLVETIPLEQAWNDFRTGEPSRVGSGGKVFVLNTGDGRITLRSR
jgi:hypothetical protein